MQVRRIYIAAAPSGGEQALRRQFGQDAPIVSNFDPDELQQVLEHIGDGDGLSILYFADNESTLQKLRRSPAFSQS